MRSPRLAFTVVCAAVLAACSGLPSEPLDPEGAGTSAPTATPDHQAPATTEPRIDAGDGSWPAPPASAMEARVLRVVDGDTVVLGGIDVGSVDRATGGRRARLIGVDTPEVFGGAECYGAEASAFAKRELDRRQVVVDFDVERTDRFGRALVYLWHVEGGVAFFNGRLAAEGYALQLTIPPNVRYAELFTRLVREAREAGKGLWSGCPVPRRAAPPADEPDPPAAAAGCHASYPDFCIPPSPPDLNCADVPSKRFTVRWDVPDPDPHGFDRNRDGIGCQS